MGLLEKLKNKISAEWDAYRNEMLQKTPDYILEKSMQTVLYEAIYYYILKYTKEYDEEHMSRVRLAVFKDICRKKNSLWYIYRKYVGANSMMVVNTIQQLFSFLEDDYMIREQEKQALKEKESEKQS